MENQHIWNILVMKINISETFGNGKSTYLEYIEIDNQHFGIIWQYKTKIIGILALEHQHICNIWQYIINMFGIFGYIKSQYLAYLALGN
jgi:uncharacterized membrane protein